MAEDKNTDNLNADDGDEFYYADGIRVELKRAPELLAVDVGRLHPGLARMVETIARNAGAAERRGVVVLELRSLPSRVRDQLESQRNAMLPVFQDGDSLVVVLPEVRVEEERAATKKRMLDWLKSRKDLEYDVQRGRIVIHPLSLDGRDALHLANEIHEELDPELSQARFMRIVRRPPAAWRRKNAPR
jgi:hypothetical protein